MANDDTTASVVTDDSLLAPMPKPVMTARKAAQPQQAAKDAADNLPQFSRIFVVCNKSTTEAELHQLFSPYGTIEHCRLLRDRDTGVSKGLCYIKYPRASAAARAIEELNGKHLHEHLPPLKVQIAEAKGSRKSTRKQYSDEPEDTPARSRLFVVCPRDLTEAQLTKEFSRFGDLEYCKVMTDRHSTESKGYSYVKFKRASTAALAMETINETGRLDGRKVKVLIADPKAKRSQEDELAAAAAAVALPMSPAHDGSAAPAGLFSYPLYLPPTAYAPYHHGDGAAYYMPAYAPAPPRNLLYVACAKHVTAAELENLFMRFVGFDFCDLKYDKLTGESTGFAFVNFMTPQAAACAINHLDGAEFPPGSLMKLSWAEPMPMLDMAAQVDPYAAAAAAAMPPYMSYHQVPYGAPYHAPPAALLPYPYASAAPAMVPATYAAAAPAAMHGKLAAAPRVLPPAVGMLSPVAVVPASPPKTVAPATAAATPSAASAVAAPECHSSRLDFTLDAPLDRTILQDVYSRFGKIKTLQLTSDRSGYVMFTTIEEARATLTHLGEVQVNGEVIAVHLAAEHNDAAASAAADDAVVPAPPGAVVCEPVA